MTHVSLDHIDDEALTPNHFLIGSSSAALPPGQFHTTDISLKICWKAAQALADQFWQRWVWEYLPTLSRWTKWTCHTTPIGIGDIVIMVDDGLPRNRWSWGKIVGTHPGLDGIIRVVDVRTKDGIYRRPVVKLWVLDIMDQNKTQ